MSTFLLFAPLFLIFLCGIVFGVLAMLWVLFFFKIEVREQVERPRLVRRRAMG